MLLMKHKTDKVWLCFIIVAVTLFLVITSQNVLVFCQNDMQVKQYKIENLKIEQMEYTLTKAEIKNIVSNLYNTPHVYIETNDLPSYQNGISHIVARIVKIKSNLSPLEYAMAYAHELTHVKYQVADETYTMYKTFTTLYESGNKELQNMALKDAQSVIYGGYGRSEYDCGYQILEYLKINCPEVL